MGDFFKKLFFPIQVILDFIQKYFKALIFLLILLLIFGTSLQHQKVPNLMKVYLEGPILSSEEVLQKLKEAEDENIRGVLFIVNSPGGLVSPSIEIAQTIKRLKEKKPVVAYAAGTMASGSYYASIWANKIIANPGSAIGSIGVIFEGANIEELAKKLGISSQVVKAGRFKEAGTPFRKWEEYEKAELQRIVNETYQMFVNDVAAARGLDPKNHETFADAHVFTAQSAKKVGLIDELGTIHEAEEEIIRQSGVEKPIWQEEDRFEKFFKDITKESAQQFMMLFFGLKASM